ncbi:MAG TPA: hypothetical protein VMI35_14520, partial [Puia sp.]|nr:hypothetical protein [Puia sp.]
MSNKDLTSKDIQELTIFFDQIVTKVNSDPGEAIEYFNEEWGLYTYTERTALVPLFIYMNKKVQEDPSAPTATKIIWSAMANKSVEKFIEDDDLQVLTFNPDEDIKKLAKVFHELKIRGHVPNTNEEIARSVSK